METATTEVMPAKKGTYLLKGYFDFIGFLASPNLTTDSIVYGA